MVDVADKAVDTSTELELVPTEPRVKSLDDVIGLSELKDELRLQLSVWADPSGLRLLGGNPRKGFVFSGPPGTGKTTTAHALASETGKTLYTFSGADFQGDKEPVRQKLIRLIEQTRDQECIVFIDEADDLLHRRDYDQELSGMLVKAMLVHLDQTTHSFKAFYIFATNMAPQYIEPALLHQGRLGRALQFRQLTLPERVKLLEHHRVRYTVTPSINLYPVASQLGSVPTADLAHLFDEGAIVAFSNGHDSIQQTDLLEAATRLRSGLKSSDLLTEKDLKHAASHEAGHALMNALVSGSWDSVSFIQISTRSNGEGGSTHIDPGNEQFMSKEDLYRNLSVAVAGVVAEEQVMGVQTAGGIADFHIASNIARSFVERWGVTDALGPMAYDDESHHNPQKEKVEEMVKQAMTEAKIRARVHLEFYDEALQLLTIHLAENLMAEGKDLRAWVGHLVPKVK